MGRLLVSVTLISYLGILSQAFAKPLPVSIEPQCTAYDEVLVNGKCEISLDKIEYCPGEIKGDKCITEPNQ